jgi:hypothetical protein
MIAPLHAPLGDSGDVSHCRARGKLPCKDWIFRSGCGRLGAPKTEPKGARRNITLMTTVTPIRNCRPTYKPVFFTRTELNLLLSLYSRRVSSGEWRDYAIDHRRGHAAFSVFRHSRDQAIYRIFKLEGPDRRCQFQVTAGSRRLRTASSLREALRLFEPKLRLVT